MTIGHVQQTDVAELRQLVHFGSSSLGAGNVAVQRHATCRSNGQHLEELSAVHAHGRNP
ncbi:hypothetical protein SDC9_164416 [bioreactor metagenome]|uniref:Uncharacterized protein n=1 Tax=bioreactor metagenome TaxID=1076179 RepID=A0A645FTK0_9ZZZZ